MQTLFLDDPHAAIRYLDFPGADLPLVFIHGLGCAGSSHFPRMVTEPAVAQHRRVVVDLFGHGYSDRPEDFGYTLEEHAQTVARLLDHLSLKACGVFGHSMGGAVAITLAALRPDLVSRLIIAEGNLDPGGGFVTRTISAQSEDEFVATGLPPLLNQLDRLRFLTSIGSFRVAGARALYQSAIGLAKGTQPTMRERLYELPIPRTFLFGERGLPDPGTDELPKHGVDVLVVSNAGHDMMFDNPSGVAEAIKQSLSAHVSQTTWNSTR